MSEPTILGNRYQLERRLGTGGMAMVYRAHDRMLERTVAIKLLRTNFSSDPDFRERFRQEAKAAANLSHPNIAMIHDFGLDNGQLYIVMELVPGTDLKVLMQRRAPFPVDEAIHLMVQACAGIGYAHRAGLVHCDVKPQNILVTPDGRLKVVDFGIARALASISPEEQAEVVWGSPQYFSPEQAAGSAPSPASDVYALGVVFFEMLTGQLPFSDPNPEELARKHREMPPPSPRALNPEIPPALEQILLKVLSKEPSARYRTADQLGRVLVSLTRTNAEVTAVPLPQFPPAVADPVIPEKTFTPPASQPIRQSTTGSARPVRARSTSRGFSFASIDWLTWLLGLLALIAVGGLIPFCLWVFYVVNPPL